MRGGHIDPWAPAESSKFNDVEIKITVKSGTSGYVMSVRSISAEMGPFDRREQTETLLLRGLR
jgi:hypothetical protein